jgi:hypothetical protein
MIRDKKNGLFFKSSTNYGSRLWHTGRKINYCLVNNVALFGN